MSAGYAAAVAPELDRIRVAISRAASARIGPLVESLGLTPECAPVLALLRNLRPARRVPLAAVHHACTYQPPIDAALDQLEAAHLITTGDDRVALAGAGVAALEQISALVSDVVEAAWADLDVDFAALRHITGVAMDAAQATAGPAYGVVAPVFEPPGTPRATAWAEALTPLRFHRYDAHIAAWQAAGLTVAEVQALPDGPLRASIETDTNNRAAAPYAALTDTQRNLLLETLRAVPAPSA